MSAHELSLGLAGMLNDIRSAGRGAPKARLEAIVDGHIPVLFKAIDAHAEESMSAPAKEQGLQALLAATTPREERIRESGGTPNPDGVLRIPWPWRKEHSDKAYSRPWAWGLAIAGAAGLLVLGVLLQSRRTEREQLIARPGPNPSLNAPGLPIPKPPPPMEEVPLVKGGPKKDRTLESEAPIVSREPETNVTVEPVPKPLKEPSVVARKQPEVGKFGRVMGEPKLVAYGSKTGVPVKRGLVVAYGSRIETGDMDKAEIRLSDGSVVTLAFNTTLTIPVSLNEGGARTITARDFELTSGSIVASVTPTKDHQKFTVETPVATAEVLGTEFGLALEKLGPATVRAVLQVKKGCVAFSNDFGGVVATAMTESTAALGSAPTEPRRVTSLKVYSFSWSSHRAGFDRLTSRLEGLKAAKSCVFPGDWSGLSAVTLTSGVLRIDDVLENSPAAQAGLMAGDIILAYNGRPLQSEEPIHHASYRAPGQNFNVRISRNGAEIEVVVRGSAGQNDLLGLPGGLDQALFDATWPALSGRANEALRRLEALAEQNPHASVYNNLGVVYETLDQMPPAIHSYQAAVRLDPTVPLYHHNLARALQNIGNLPRAVEEYEAAVNLDADYHDAIIDLAESYGLVDQNDNALAFVKSARSRLPHCPHILLMESFLLLRDGQRDAAIEVAAEATRMAPTFGYARFRHGLALTYAGRHEEAEAAFKNAVELSPEEPNYHNSRAINFESLSRPDLAEVEFQRAIELDPKHFNARINYGGLLSSMSRYSEAEPMLRMAIEINPRAPDAYYNLAQMLRGLERMEEAAEMLGKAIELNSANVEYHWVYAATLADLGKFKESMAAYENAVRAAPAIPDLRCALGWAQIENHRWADAVDSYRKCQQIDPKGPDVLSSLNNIGLALIHLGELGEAEAALAEALKLKPDDAEASSNWALLLAHKGTNLDEALDRALKTTQPNSYAQRFQVLGFVHYKRGEFDAAIEQLEKAAKGYGKVYLAADALVTLGKVYEAKGQVDPAKGAYRRALVIERENKEAADALKRLGG
ncbi:MAG: tetratricopeptide repeat protein [Armatimonadetes bacterium]|nr:tetratricopeptide repeat protein [Armatimonadota bacterium]